MAIQVENEWVVSVFEKLRQVTPARSYGDHSIYLVPEFLRRLKTDHFKCQILSLGLYNRDFTNETSIDKLKLEVLAVFLKHLQSLESLQSLDRRRWNTFRDEITRLPPDRTNLRDFYHDEFPGKSSMTVEVIQSVLTIDAVFIIAVYHRYIVGGEFDNNNAAFRNELLTILRRGTVQNQLQVFKEDMWLLENQIPLFLLKNIFTKIRNESREFSTCLRDIVLDWAEWHGFPINPESRKREIPSLESCSHLMACFHEVVCTPIPRVVSSSGRPTDPESLNSGISLKYFGHLMACFHKVVCMPIQPSVSSSGHSTDPESLNSSTSLKSCGPIFPSFGKVVCVPMRPSNPSNGPGYYGQYASKIIKMLVRSRAVVLVPVAIVKKLISLATPNTTTSIGGQTRESTGSQYGEGGKRTHLPTVSQLRKVGIRVRGIRTNPTGIQFVPSMFGLVGTLYLPQMKFQDDSVKIMLNLCVYEQLIFPRIDKAFIAYFCILDYLVNTEEDVRLLEEGEHPVIVTMLLGDNKIAADTINNMLQNFNWSVSNEQQEIIDKILVWYSAHWRHQLTHFIDRFIIAPWILMSLVAASILLLSTVLQTVYTILGFQRN